MHNPIIESELQDICAFRKSILDSFTKIQYKFPKTNTPIKLNAQCQCSQSIIPFDPFYNCSIQDIITKNFSQKEGFLDKGKTKKPLHENWNVLNLYRDQHNVRKLKFEIQPRIQRTSIENLAYTPIIDQKIKEKFNNLNQDTGKFHDTCQKKLIQNYKRNISSNQHWNSPEQTKQNILKPYLNVEIGWKQDQNRYHSLEKKRDPSKEIVRRRQSYSEAIPLKIFQNECSSKKQPSTQRYLFGKKLKNDKKAEIKQVVYKNIKKRIYLSGILYKQAQNNALANHQIVDRERQEIIKKIVCYPTIVKKYLNSKNTK